MVLNYLGPNFGEGIRIYFDGTVRTFGRVMTASEVSAGDGRIVMGRHYTDLDQNYASVQVDELIFFNQALSPSDVTALWHHAD